MKKHLYLLLPLLTPTPSMAMWSWVFGKTIKSTIIASTLVLSHYSYDKKRSLRLHQAVEQNNSILAQNLINNTYVDVNAKINGTTPLIQCCKKGDKSLQIAQALLKHKHINVNLPNNDGWTPLLVCCQTGDDALKIAQELLKHQHINVNLQDNEGRTPLIWCSARGKVALQIAQELLKHKNINVNLQNNNGNTALDNIILDYLIYYLIGWDNKENYKYVQLWNLLVAQGAVLKNLKADYENLKPSDLEEPHRTYIHLIKQNPPKN